MQIHIDSYTINTLLVLNIVHFVAGQISVGFCILSSWKVDLLLEDDRFLCKTDE